MIFEYEHLIQFYETDAMRIVHHSNYLRWFEEARLVWLSEIGYSYKQMEDEGIMIPVLSAQAEYKQMLAFGSTAIIRLRISHFTPVRMTVEYKVYNKETGDLTTTGSTSHCFLDAETQRPLSLKRKHPDILAAFEKAQADSKED